MKKLFLFFGAQNYLIFMKKSLALKLERTEKSISKNKLSLYPREVATAGKPKSSLRLDLSPYPKMMSQNGSTTIKPTTYRNKNLSVLPASLLSALSSLTILDISHNKLTDSQIEILMNSCPKLETLSIQGNLTSIIPGTIVKLKNLDKFRHDWVKLNPNANYETEANLKCIKQVVKKPSTTVKINNVIGINFEIYCRQVIKVQMNLALQQKVNQSQCSYFAQNQMTEAIRLSMAGKGSPIPQAEEIVEKHSSVDKPLPAIAGCFNICGFDVDGQVRPQEQKWREIPHKKQLSKNMKSREDSMEETSSNIKIEKIRDINETEAGSEFAPTLAEHQEIVYQYKQMPLHLLFSHYDSKNNGAIDIDRILLKGYNPNTYDRNGLSPYHIVVIFRQQKALQRLLQISFKNPGFFDLQMPSLKEGRNLLHFSVFLKDFQFTKRMIDFGFPVDKRDFSGARLVHLVDQNYEFLLMLRKAIKKRYNPEKNASFFTYPQPMAKKYTRHPPRVTQESNYQTFENKNLNLMQMYEAAVTLRKGK